MATAQELTTEEQQLLRELAEKAGYEVRKPHASTERRRKQRAGRTFPVIARSGRSYVEDDGRRYGELSGSEQRQADAGYWRVGQAVRSDLEPMTVSVKGTVVRILEVLGWEQDPGGKWVADLGRTLTDDDLDREFPDYPYRLGDDCPTRAGGAYRPETY